LADWLIEQEMFPIVQTLTKNNYEVIWKKETSIITLFQDNEAQTSFRLTKIDEVTQYGLKKGWALVPNENDAFIGNCEFEFTVILQY
jgi:hypothetical protein|tara:strand:+ start:29 stop:289 length:261 start_codon:yes stop_codon:yes gene_type:complete